MRGGPEGHLEQRSSQVTRSGGVDEKKKETKSDIRREPIVNQTSVKSGVDICSTSADNEVSHVSLQLFNTSTDARLVHHLSEQTPSCSEGGPGV